MTVLTPHWRRRLDDGQLEHFFPDANADRLYELADPLREGAGDGILVTSIDMALHLVRDYDFSIRMRGNVTGRWNLIPAQQIECLR